MNVAEYDGPRGGHGSTVPHLYISRVSAGTPFATVARGGRKMADNDTPNRAANKDKAEGERWKSEQGVIPNSESSTDRGYSDDNGDNAGGITNRSIGEEVDNQNSLPDRGRTQRDEQVRGNEDVER